MGISPYDGTAEGDGVNVGDGIGGAGLEGTGGGAVGLDHLYTGTDQGDYWNMSLLENLGQTTSGTGDVSVSDPVGLCIGSKASDSFSIGNTNSAPRATAGDGFVTFGTADILYNLTLYDNFGGSALGDIFCVLGMRYRINTANSFNSLSQGFNNTTKRDDGSRSYISGTPAGPTNEWFMQAKGGTPTFDQSATYKDGNWHTIIWQFGNSMGDQWLDGTKVASNSNDFLDGTSLTRYGFGGLNSTSSPNVGLDGDIYKCMLWKTEQGSQLDDSQIAEIQAWLEL